MTSGVFPDEPTITSESVILPWAGDIFHWPRAWDVCPLRSERPKKVTLRQTGGSECDAIHAYKDRADPWAASYRPVCGGHRFFDRGICAQIFGFKSWRKIEL